MFNPANRRIWVRNLHFLWPALLLGTSIAAGCGGGGTTTTDAGDDGGPIEGLVEDGRTEDGLTEDVAPDEGGADEASDDDGATDTGPGCGNGVLEGDEVCDGLALGGASCESLGYTTGTLACTPGCLFDETGCSSSCDNGACERGETATSCPGDCGVVDVATGSYHTCAVLADGSLWCWGAWIGHRAGGLGDERVPVKVAGVSGLTGICSGVGHSCVTTSDGRVLCWGRNGFGEAGQSPRHALIFPPAEVPDLTGAEDLTCGLHHTCVQIGGQIRCWGRNDYGQLGTDYSVRHEEPSTVVSASGGFSDVGAGARHTCAVSGAGTRRFYWCWGFGGTGALGRGNLAWSITPVGGGSTDVAQIEAGTFHTCSLHRALLGDAGSIRCWGSNEHGQVGVADAGPVLGPTATGVRDVRVLALGRAHSCAGGDTQARCWGLNEDGQLGNGTTTSTHVAQSVGLTGGVTALASLWDHTCAILADRTLRCWGVNERGQLGDGTTEAMRSTPVEPVGL
jgi:alpha-tubulin suppressor-like RCC1 family protein